MMWIFFATAKAKYNFMSVIWFSGWFLFIFHCVLSDMHGWAAYWCDGVCAYVCVHVSARACLWECNVVTEHLYPSFGWGCCKFLAAQVRWAIRMKKRDTKKWIEKKRYRKWTIQLRLVENKDSAFNDKGKINSQTTTSKVLFCFVLL